MENKTKEVAKAQPQTGLKQFFSSEAVKNGFKTVLKDRSDAFITSVLSLAYNNNLSECDPMSVYTAAMKAATLNLPIDQNLGFAYIIPYNERKPDGTYRKVAQFQIGYKGIVQLALRSGQYKVLNAGVVYENQFRKFDPLFEELDADLSLPPKGKAVGYFAAYELVNGMRKMIFWTREMVEDHRKKYSKNSDKATSVWNIDFDKMAIKTVLKQLIQHWGIMSIEYINSDLDNVLKAEPEPENETELQTFTEVRTPDGNEVNN